MTQVLSFMSAICKLQKASESRGGLVTTQTDGPHLQNIQLPRCGLEEPEDLALENLHWPWNYTQRILALQYSNRERKKWVMVKVAGIQGGEDSHISIYFLRICDNHKRKPIYFQEGTLQKFIKRQTGLGSTSLGEERWTEKVGKLEHLVSDGYHCK